MASLYLSPKCLVTWNQRTIYGQEGSSAFWKGSFSCKHSSTASPSVHCEAEDVWKAFCVRGGAMTGKAPMDPSRLCLSIAKHLFLVTAGMRVLAQKWFLVSFPRFHKVLTLCLGHPQDEYACWLSIGTVPVYWIMLPIRARMPIIHQARLQLALQACTVLALVMCEVDVEPSKPGQETQQISTNTGWSLGLGLIFLCQGLALWDWPGRKTCLELCRTTCESPVNFTNIDKKTSIRKFTSQFGSHLPNHEQAAAPQSDGA